MVYSIYSLAITVYMYENQGSLLEPERSNRTYTPNSRFSWNVLSEPAANNSEVLSFVYRDTMRVFLLHFCAILAIFSI